MAGFLVLLLSRASFPTLYRHGEGIPGKLVHTEGKNCDSRVYHTVVSCSNWRSGKVWTFARFEIRALENTLLISPVYMHGSNWWLSLSGHYLRYNSSNAQFKVTGSNWNSSYLLHKQNRLMMESLAPGHFHRNYSSF